MSQQYPHFAAAKRAAQQLSAVEAPGAVLTDLSMIGDLSHGTFSDVWVRRFVADIKAGKDTTANPAYTKRYTHRYDAEANAAQTGAGLPTPDPGRTIPQGITGGAATGLLHDFTSWEKALQAILTALASGQFWIRAGEVVIGGSLVLIGIDSMLKLGLVQKGSEAAKVAAFA